MLIITCRCYSYARFTDPKLRLREVKSVCRQTCGDQCRSIPPPPSWKENPSLVKLEVCPPSGRLCVLVLKGGPHRGSGSCGMLGKLLNRLSFLISRIGVLILPLAGCGEDEMSQHVCVTQKGSLHVVSLASLIYRCCESAHVSAGRPAATGGVKSHVQGI